MLIPANQIAWFKTIRANLATDHTRILIGQKTQVRLRGKVSGGGTLGIGSQWPDLMPLPTMLVVRTGCELTVTGAFRFLSGCHVGIGQGGRLRLGSGYMSSEGRISCEHSITIGNDVAIGPRVSIRDDDGHDLIGSTRSGPITIGNHVWIGEGVCILKGVSIGDGAIIAAGSIVTRDISAGMLAAGAPCRQIRPARWK